MKNVFIFIMFALIMSLAACGSGDAKENGVSKEESKKVEVSVSGEKTSSLVDTVKEITQEEVGDKAKKSDGKARIIDIRTIEDVIAGNGNNIVEVEMNADQNATIARTRDEMLLQSADLFPELLKVEGVSEVALLWSLPLEDVKGNSDSKTVMKIRIRKENDINWDKFDVYNFEHVDDQYYEHKAIQVK